MILTLFVIKIAETVMLLNKPWNGVDRAFSPVLPDCGTPLYSIATMIIHLHGGGVRVVLSVQTMVLARMTLARIFTSGAFRNTKRGNGSVTFQTGVGGGQELELNI